MKLLAGKETTSVKRADWNRATDCRVMKWVVDLLPHRVKEILKRLTTPPLESLPDAPGLFQQYRYFCQHHELERKPGGWLYKGRFYPDYLTVGGASHAIFREALKWCRGQGVDLGAGLWPLPGAIPVDLSQGLGQGRSIADFADSSLDYLFSSHCLEHIADWRKALSQWASKVRLDGYIFLYLPHPECALWHPGSPMVGDGHKWLPEPAIIKFEFQKLGCEIVSFDDGPDAMHSFYVCARKKPTL